MRRFTGASAVVALAGLLLSGCTLIGPMGGGDGPATVVAEGRGPIHAPRDLVASLEADRDHVLPLQPGDRLWRPRSVSDPDGPGQVFQRRMPPCGATGAWGHWDYDEQLTDFHHRLTRRDDGTVFDAQLAVYDSANAAAGWVAQFRARHFRCSTVRTKTGDVPVDSATFSDHDPGHHALGMDQPRGRVQIYQLRGGERGGAMTMAFRKNNAVLLITRWDPNEAWPRLTEGNGRRWFNLQFGAYDEIAQFAHPTITLLHDYYS